MQRYEGQVADQYGNAVIATVSVYNANTVVLPVIYSDNGITVKSNPWQTDTLGRYFFYAAGRFDIAISGPRITPYTISDVLLQDYPALAALPTSIYAALAAPSGSSLVGFIQSGTGPNTTRTSQAKLREAPASPEDKGAVGDGVTSDQTAIVNLLADAVTAGKRNVQLVNDHLVTSLSNTRGVELLPGASVGRILKAITGGNQQLNSYADFYKLTTGREYLSAFHKKIIARTSPSIVFTGDSTTAGTGSTSPYTIPELILEQARIDGFYGVSVNNQGHGGESTVEWLATRLAVDLALNPDLYVIRWGINDPYTPGSNLTVAQFIANIRTGLTTLRAARTLAQTSVVLMMPNSVSDTANGRDEKWHEQIVLGLKQAARDFQCCFIDTYAYLQDSRNATDYMDTVGATHIHPANVMNTWISTILCDAIFPKGLRQVAENRLFNLGSATTIKAAGDATSTYEKGISIYRANPGGAGSNWPFDGIVVTFNAADNVQLQINSSYNNALSSYAVRLGQSNVWQAWNYSYDNVANAWTPTLVGSSVAGANTYSGSTSGFYVRNGKMITAYFTIILTAKDGAMAGNISIGGLPFAAGAYSPVMSASISRWSNITLTGGYTQLGAHVSGSAQSALLIQSGSASAAATVAAAAISATTEIYGFVSYVTA